MAAQASPAPAAIRRALSRFRPLLWLLAILLPAGLGCRGIMDAVSETPQLAFAPEELPAANLGRPYSSTITITDQLTPVQQVTVVAGDLPPGLTLSHDAADETATISGVATVAGRYTFTIEAKCYDLDRVGQSGQHEYQIRVLSPAQTLIRAGTQLHHDPLAIGIGNIWEEEYVDESGATVTGLTTGLWINSPGMEQHFQRAHPGQQIIFGDYTIRVVEVGRDGSGDYAVVEVGRVD